MSKLEEGREAKSRLNYLTNLTYFFFFVFLCIYFVKQGLNFFLRLPLYIFCKTRFSVTLLNIKIVQSLYYIVLVISGVG